MTDNKLTLLRNIWPLLTEADFNDDDYTSFFDFITSKISLLEEHANLVPVSSSLEKWLQVIPDLKDISRMTRHAAIEYVSGKHHFIRQDPHSLSITIDTLICLWLSLEVRSPDGMLTGDVSRNMGSILWNEGNNLQQATRDHFSKDEPSLLPTRRARIDPRLTMVRLASAYGFRPTWVHNLALHLDIDWKNRTIMIYEHKVSIWNHLRFIDEQILEKELLEEAMDTLNLLFPFDDDATQKFLQSQGKEFFKLGSCKRQRELRLDRYIH